MELRIGETHYLDFTTNDGTGAATDADSTPTAEVFEDANDTAIIAPTVTKRTGKTGNYRLPVAATVANGYEVGKSYNVVATVVMGGITSKKVVGTFKVRTANALFLGIWLRKYNVLLVTGTTAIRFMLPKRGGGFITDADWTPQAGDVTRSINGAAAGNVTNLPGFVNGMWELILTAAELTAVQTTVHINPANSAGAALSVETYGHASAMYVDDLSAASSGGGLDAAGVRAAIGMASANLDTQLAALQADTDDIQTKVAASAIRAAVGLASANLDTQLAALNALATAIAGYIDTEITDIRNRLPAALIGGRMDVTVGDAASIRLALGMAAANMDTTLAALATLLDDQPTNAELAAALALHTGDTTGTVAADGGNSETTVKVTTNAGAKTLVGIMRITSGALNGERCLGYITGTQFAVLSQTTMPTALKQFSAVPANGVTYTFRPF